MTRGWLPGTFSKVRVAGLKDKLPFPEFVLKKPEDVSDDMIVEEIEQEAVANRRSLSDEGAQFF